MSPRHVAVGVVASVALAGCIVRHWEAYAPNDLGAIEVPPATRGPYVALELADGQWIRGWLVAVDVPNNRVTVEVRRDGERLDAEVRLDAVVGARIGETDVPLTVLATTGAVVGISAGAWVILLLIILATKDSCPIVYVDGPDGLVQVGEGYSGAVAPSLQRADRLALPDRDGPVHVRLVDEAHETQNTDVAWLVAVEHAPGTRALARWKGGTVVTGASIAPTRVVDLGGRDVMPLVVADDRAAWATDMDAATRAAAPPTEEGLVAHLDAAPANAALELVVANQPWIDLVAGRFWASAGGQLDEIQARQASPEAKERLLGVFRDAGFHTAVEVRTDAGWRTVGWLEPPGWVQPRQLVIPLDVPEGAPVDVRLRGGVGFLAVDHVAFTRVLDAAPAETVYRPRAIQADGADVSAALASVDGVYQVLPDRDAYVDLTWDLPPTTGERALFLHLDGWYLVHPKPDAKLDLRLASVIATRPERTGQVSVDLYRELMDRLGR